MSRLVAIAAVLLAASPAVAADWRKEFPGFTPLVDGNTATPAQARLFGEDAVARAGGAADRSDPVTDCDHTPFIWAVEGQGWTVLASLVDGVQIFERGKPVGEATEPLNCLGSQAAWEGLALGQLVPDDDPEIVGLSTLGGRHDFETTVEVWKRRGDRLVSVLSATAGKVRVLGPGRVQVGGKTLVWDAASFGFVAPGARRLKVAEPIAIASVEATSTYAAKNDAYGAWRTVFPTVNDDGWGGMEGILPLSAWCEGKPDEGIGEGVTIRFARPTQLGRVVIDAGVWKTEKLFLENNRISKLVVTTSDGRTVPVDVDLSSPRLSTFVEMGDQPVTWLKVAIAEVKKGRMNDSCISAIIPNAGPLVMDMPPGAIEALGMAVPAIDDALAGCTVPAVAAWIDFPITSRGLTWAEWERGKKPTPVSFRDAGALAAARCPIPRHGDDAVSYMDARRGEVTVSVSPEHKEEFSLWHLVWRDGRWHLRAVGFSL